MSADAQFEHAEHVDGGAEHLLETRESGGEAGGRVEDLESCLVWSSSESINGPFFSTLLESRVSSGLSWAETMEQEETLNPAGSMEVEEAAGEEPSIGDIKLFTLADN